MKTLTPIAEAERKNTSKNVFWVAEMNLPDGTRRFSSRVLSLGEIFYASKLVRVKSLEQEMGRESPLGRSRAVLEITNLWADLEERLQYLAEIDSLEGRDVRIGVLFQDSGKTAESGDVIHLGDFVVSGVDFSPLQAVLFLEDPLAARAGLPLLRRLKGDVLSGLLDETGLDLPVVFGSAGNCPLILLPFSRALNVRTKLDGELTPEAKCLKLEDVSLLPPRGRLQLGDEVLEYRAVDVATRTVGSEASPLIRLEAGYHPDGTLVRFLPPEGLYYFVADHPCLRISGINAAGKPLGEDQASVISMNLEGRQTCAVHIERYPSYVRLSSAVSQLRFDGLRSSSAFLVKKESTALFSDRAVDGYPGITAAKMDADHSRIALEFREDLSCGLRRFGVLTRAGIEVRYFSSSHPGSRASVNLSVKKGQETRDMRVPWPEEASSLASFPEISLSVEGTMGELEEFSPSLCPENSLVVNLDEASGEEDLGEGNFRWKDSHYAKDGHFGFSAVNFSGPGMNANTTPLILRLLRKPMLDAAAILTRVHFHAMMDSSGTPQKDVRVAMRLADRLNISTLFRVDGQKREYVFEAPVPDVTFEHLMDSVTRFSIETPDGSALRVYEAWVEIFYRLHSPAGQAKDYYQGYKEGVLKSLEITLPTPEVSLHMDITDMARNQGDWGFFSGGGDAPQVTLELSSREECVYVSDVALVLEYRSRVGAVLEDRVYASVEGIHENGTLVQNPADIVRHILSHGNFLGFSEEEIDQASFESLHDRMQESGAVYQNRFGQEIETGEALKAVLEGSRMRLVHEGGRFRLLPPAWDPSVLGESLATDFAITNNLLLDMEPVIMERSKDSYLRRMTICAPLEAIHLERGDRVSLTSSELLLDRALCELSGFDIPSPDQIRLHLDLVLTGHICWEHDEETMIRRVSGGSAMIFYINRIAVARLEKTGDLYLRGEIWEDTLEEKITSAPIQYDGAGKRILFCAAEGSAYSAIFALDEQGNLLTRAEVVETKIPTGLCSTNCYNTLSHAGEEYFLLSLDCTHPLMAAEKSSGRIYIKGEVYEKDEG
jgi:hypothetical protein